MPRLTIFTKIVLILIVLLVPIAVLYAYSYRASVEVVGEQVRSSSLQQLSFLQVQVDNQIDQLSMFPVIAISDPYIRSYVDRPPADHFERLTREEVISQKLGLQSVSSDWSNVLTMFLPHEQKVLSSSIFATYSEPYLRSHMQHDWAYEPPAKPGQSGEFVRQLVEPAKAVTLEQADTVFQVKFSAQNLVGILDQFKRGGKGDPFLLRSGLPPIGNRTLDVARVKELLAQADGGPAESWGASGQRVVELDGQQYDMMFARLRTLDWYLVDYVPMESILIPINFSRNLFYGSTALLLGFGLLAAFLLWRNVQLPIRKLVTGVQRLKKGDFSARIEGRPGNEFGFLFSRFNEMAEQTQELIETVYKEQLRSREATLKQLQAQINPHFLYNSLFFIVNMAHLNDNASVIRMAQNLGDYYRYATRTERSDASLSEELALLNSYLEVQNLRLQRIYTEMDIPASMLELRLPRLLLQPIVENAIVHGAEKENRDMVLRLSGRLNGAECMVSVEDSGPGMNPEGLRQLQRQLEQPMDDRSGFGLWNVHQRLLHRFGAGAGLLLNRSELGGLKVTLRWPIAAHERAGEGET